MSDLSRQLARMMWWREFAAYPVVALMLAVIAFETLPLARSWRSQQGWVAPATDIALVVLALLIAVSALVIWLCWLVALWHIFLVGRMAFGTGSGLVYTFLGLILFPWPGLYVIPQMLRLDVRRLLGVEPDALEGKAAEAVAVD